MENKTISTDRPIAIYYTFQTNVNSYSAVGNSNCTISINGEWNYIHTSIGKLNLNENPANGAPGTKFVTNLSVVCPGHDENTPEDIASISGRKAVFKIVYRSGKKKIIGNRDSGPKPILRTQSDNSTQRILEFSWEHSSPNRWLS